jgi:hypothetical protein
VRKLVSLAIALGLLAVPALSSAAPRWRRAAASGAHAFVDVDNDGKYGPGDVVIDDLFADGRFDTSKAERGYTPPAGKVGVVIPAGARGLVPRNGNFILIASGDITVNESLTVTSKTRTLLLVSTGGKITVGDDVAIVGGAFMKLDAQDDVVLGDNCKLSTRGNSFSAVTAVVSHTGDVVVGSRCELTGGGLTQLATPEDGGGQVLVGNKTRISATRGTAQVTAGLDLMMDGTQVTSPNILLGSHASVHSPGHAMIRNAMLRAGTSRGRIRIYADGGSGSMVDLSNTKVRLSNPEFVLITADQIIE